MSDFDIVVVGGGMAGAAAAVGLARDGFRVAMVDPRPPRAVTGEDPFELRVSTLSPASVNVLDRLGAWPSITGVRACGFRAMRVWEDHPDAALVFEAGDAGLPILGHVVENELVRHALWQAAGAVECLTSGFESLQRLRDETALTLTDGQSITTRLLVAADGARSRIRELLDIDVTRKPYHQAGVVCQVHCSGGLRDTAWQRFMDEGPLAFLPLGPEQASIVWSVPEHKATYLVECATERFLELLQQASQDALGRLSVAGPRGRFPLQRLSAERYFARGCVLIGDAAHVVHPLAGQGANLAMLDVAALIETLTTAREENRGIDDPVVLRRYERWRRSDAVLMSGSLDLLKQIYALPSPMAELRRAGTRVLDALPWLKARFVEHASGFGGRVPSLAARRIVP